MLLFLILLLIFRRIIVRGIREAVFGFSSTDFVMDRSGRRRVEAPTLKVGDVEKEREIELRLRELGLWENKRRLENDVSTMLNARIDEQDALSKTLENCRRRRQRRRRSGPDARSSADEIRDVISIRVVRDSYGQKLAYHVNVLMGYFNRDVRYDLVGDGVVVCGSTGAQDDSTRLTKEMRLQLPPSVNMAALTISYAAGAVKIRVPYLLESLSKSRSALNDSGDNDDDNNNNGGRPCRFASISPIYSLSLQLNDRHRRALGSSESPTTMRSDSPDMNGTPDSSSLGSVKSETRSVGDEVQLSPYPVSEEEGLTQLNGFTPSDEICRSSSRTSGVTDN